VPLGGGGLGRRDDRLRLFTPSAHRPSGSVWSCRRSRRAGRTAITGSGAGTTTSASGLPRSTGTSWIATTSAATVKRTIRTRRDTGRASGRIGQRADVAAPSRTTTTPRVPQPDTEGSERGWVLQEAERPQEFDPLAHRTSSDRRRHLRSQEFAIQRPACLLQDFVLDHEVSPW